MRKRSFARDGKDEMTSGFFDGGTVRDRREKIDDGKMRKAKGFESEARERFGSGI